jgi:hypothetical protein
MEAILTTPFPVLATASWAAAIMMLTRSWLRSTAAKRNLSYCYPCCPNVAASGARPCRRAGQQLMGYGSPQNFPRTCPFL